MKKRLLSLGMGGVSKTDESEKFRREGGVAGSFSIQKFMLQILDLLTALLSDFFQKKTQYKFSKMRGRGWGGSEAVWNIFENSSVLETLPVSYGAFVCFGVI